MHLKTDKIFLIHLIKTLDVINETINLTDKGSVRVAEKKMEIGLSINGLKRLFC